MTGTFGAVWAGAPLGDIMVDTAVAGVSLRDRLMGLSDCRT